LLNLAADDQLIRLWREFRDRAGRWGAGELPAGRGVLLLARAIAGFGRWGAVGHDL